MARAVTDQFRWLTKQTAARLQAGAKRKGIKPEIYAKELIEDALSLQREAERSSFAEIMAPVRNAAGSVDDAEIVALVERARAAHHANRRKKR